MFDDWYLHLLLTFIFFWQRMALRGCYYSLYLCQKDDSLSDSYSKESVIVASASRRTSLTCLLPSSPCVPVITKSAAIPDKNCDITTLLNRTRLFAAHQPPATAWWWVVSGYCCPARRLSIIQIRVSSKRSVSNRTSFVRSGDVVWCVKHSSYRPRLPAPAHWTMNTCSQSSSPPDQLF